MSFSTLPAELKLDITKYLDPEATLRLALTCKEFATYCKSILKMHHQKLSEWQVLDTTEGVALLWEFLKNVLHDPSIGWYVRELNLTQSRQYHDMEEILSQEDQELLNNAARQLQNLYPVEERYDDEGDNTPFDIEDLIPSNLIDSIQKRISKNCEDGIIALLLHYLPFLDTFKITSIDDDCLELFLWHVTDKYKNATHSAHLPLRHLTTAVVVHWDTEMCCHADWACFFTGLPSLKTFVAGSMGESPRLELAHNDRFSTSYVPISNVTELFFPHCQFAVEGLATILAGIKNLKKFTYTEGGATVAYVDYEPKRMIQALVKHAGHSLEELVLDRDEDRVDLSNEGDLNSTSLRDFQKLRLLDCGWNILRPAEGDDDEDLDSLDEGFYKAEDNPNTPSVFDMRTILPVSLQELYMHGGEGISDEDWKHLWNIFKFPNAWTPNLRLENTCIQRFHPRFGTGMPSVDMSVIGEAAPPTPLHHRRLHQLMEGHGYMG